MNLIFYGKECKIKNNKKGKCSFVLNYRVVTTLSFFLFLLSVWTHSYFFFCVPSPPHHTVHGINTVLYWQTTFFKGKPLYLTLYLTITNNSLKFYYPCQRQRNLYYFVKKSIVEINREFLFYKKNYFVTTLY